MAHGGQKLALGKIGGLCGLLRLIVLCDIDTKTDGVARQGAFFSDSEPSATPDILNQLLVALPMPGQSLGNPVFFATVSRRVLPACDSITNNFLERATGLNNGCRNAVNITELFIAKNQSVIGVIDHKGFVYGLDGGAQ